MVLIGTEYHPLQWTTSDHMKQTVLL